ncbi:carbohydrate-binding protein [Roseobacter ponti]|uniref:Carbohydrate-binding protein n=1 Tax=Roseobacter ponti TaxID=1891787 RepID=A0A858SPK7_9RHOB|nr:carbohydrate-binding protein [Roseobacter ponti]QJF50330.1 carbohydrate-binding protein [Roseobacter ponti]
MPIDTIIFEGEDLTLTTTPSGSASLARTQFGNWEKNGIDASDGEDNGVAASNPGLPEFDEYGLRAGYSGDGYLDINGNAQPKASFTVDTADVPPGDYQLTIRGDSSTDRFIQIEIDGVVQTTDSVAAQSFGTGSFSEWELRTFDITIPESTEPVVITIVQVTATAAPNIDAIALHDIGEAVTFFAPEIVSVPVFEMEDNGSVVGTIEATDTQDVTGTDSTLSYALSGADVALFSISDTGELSFNEQPDADTPSSAAGNNTYSVTVEVDDGVESVTQDVTVNVVEAVVRPVIEPIIVLVEDAIIPDGADTVLRSQDGNPEGTVTGKDIYGLWEGYSGTGYIDFNTIGSGIAGDEAFSFDVTVAEAGLYSMHLRLMSISGNRPLDIGVNGITQQASVATSGTGFGNDTWLVRDAIPLELAEGTNTITIAIPDGVNNGPNIDAIAITTEGDAAPVFPASNEAPVFDNAPTAVDVEENASEVADFTVTDDGLGDVTYTLTGADAALFEISDTGSLSFITPPVFDDGDGATNSYNVSVTISDEANTDAVNGDSVVPETVDVVVTVTEEIVTPVIDPIIALAEDAVIPDGATTRLSSQVESFENPSSFGSKDAYGLWPGYSGTGYVDFNGDGTGITGVEAITFEITVAEAGVYDMYVRFTNNAPDRPLDIGVNGELQEAEAAFIGTGFGNWSVTDAIALSLDVGLNTVTFAVPAGKNNGPNIDAIAITSSGDPAPVFPAENEAPVFDVAPAAVDVAENTTEVADFSVADDGLGDVTYALSGPDAALFEISDTGSLSFIAAPDFETPGSDAGTNTYNVTVSISDEANTPAVNGTTVAPEMVDVVVTVTDVVGDVPPSAVTLTAVPFDEEVAGAVVATVAVTDPDTTYSAADLVLTDPSELFELVDGDAGVEVRLIAGEALDFEEALEPEISVSAAGVSSLPLTVIPTDVTEDVPASAVTLTAVAFDENVAGAVVATVAVTDPDTTYAAADLLLTDASGLFELVDGDAGVEVKLKAGEALDFEAGLEPQIFVSLGALNSETLTVIPEDIDEGPRQVTFEGAITSYSTQDRPDTGTATPTEAGTSLEVSGNLWKRVDIGEAFDITDNSKLLVDIEPGVNTPELVLIGFDADDSPFQVDENSIFNLAGSQTPPGTLVDLRGTGEVQPDGKLRFEIDLSGLAGQSFSSIVVASDDDNATDGYGSVTFSNVFLSNEPGDTGGNTAPETVGGGISDFSVDEGGSLEVDLPFIDQEGDPITYGFEVLDDTGAPVVVAGLGISGNVLSGPAPVLPGVYTINITADDGQGGIGTDSFEVTVVDINDAPVAQDVAFEPFFGAVGQAIDEIDIAQFAGAFSDPDGDTLELIVSGLPQGMSVNSEGVITGTPTDTGSGSFSIIARDPDGAESAPVIIELIIDAPQLGDEVIIEAEDFTGLPDALNFYSAAQVGASENRLIRVDGGEAGLVTSQLSLNGVAEGFYQVRIDMYDETDGTATFSLQIGGTVLASDATIDGLGEFNGDGVTGRGNAGQVGNSKTISFDPVVFIDADTLLTLSGQADGELLRTDRLVLTRVEQPNILPEAITLTSSEVAEATDGAVVGDLSATDPDGDDGAVSFTVADESPFEIVGTTLKLKAGQTLDFETITSIDVDVTAEDADGGISVATLTIAVTDVDEAPTGLILVGDSVDENAAGAIIGTLGATDPEDGTLTFSVTDPRFVVEGTTLRLADGVSLDAEDPTPVTVEVSVTDGTTPSSETFDITVNDVNEAPTLADGAVLNDVTVDFATGERVDLSVLGATDPDGDAVGFTVRSATTDPLPAGITIDGGELVVADDLAPGTYAIEVLATDGALDSAPVGLSVTVGDPAPFVPFEVQPSDASITLSTAPDGDATVTIHRDENVAGDAETAGGGKILENGIRAGYSGTGYVDFGDDPGDAAVFTFIVPVAGEYDLNIRYASQDAGGNPRTLDIAINDGDPATTVFASTGPGTGDAALQGFNVWGFVTQTVTLEAGQNTVSLIMSPGTNAGPNVDRIEITGAGTGPIVTDTTADEGDDLAATGPVDAVEAVDADAVDFTLAGVDDDIILVEASVNGGGFAEVIPVADIVTLDLSGAGEGEVTVTFRVSDEAGNTAETGASVTIGEVVVAPFDLTIQLEARDDTVTIIDDTGTGEGDPASTQVRDSLNPEANSNGGKVDGLWPGFNGTGYLDMGTDVGDAYSFEVDVPEAGEYVFDFRFNQGSGTTPTRPMTLSVGTEVAATLDFPSNGDWTIWQTESATVTLAAGVNVITMTNTVANGPNFDQVEITRAGVVPDTSADEDEFPLELGGPSGTLSPSQVGSISLNVSGDDEDIVKFEISFDGGTTRSEVPAIDADGDFVIDGSGLAPGLQTVTLIVTDDAGNEASDAISFFIPQPGIDPITLQAEDALITDLGAPGTGPDGRAETRIVNPENPDPFGNFRGGAVGDEYVDFGENPGDAITFTVDAPVAGTYTASIRYANGVDASRPLVLSVNDGAEATVDFVSTNPGAATNGWENWTDIDVTVTLTAGTNTVKLAIADGTSTGPNIDQITFTPDQVEPEQGSERFTDVIRVNFEAPPEGNGSFNAPAGYTTPAGFESDTGEAYGARGNGFTYGWVDIDDTTGEVTGTPLAQPTGSARFKDVVPEASDLQKTYLHFDYPGAPDGDRERAWEIEVENGTYELTVSIGDTGGQYDSDYVLNVEGVQFGNDWIPVNLAGEQLVGGAYNSSFDGEGFRSALFTGIVQVTDGRLTIDGTDGENVEIQWLDLQQIPDLTPEDGRTADLDYSKFVSAVAASTQDGQVTIEIGEDGTLPTGINPLSDIVVGVQLQTAENSGPDVAFTNGVKLVETLTGIEVAINVQVTGGADSMTIRPLSDLKEFTSYTLLVEDVLDLGSIFDADAPKRQFQDYSTTFVTGETPVVEAKEVAFTDQVILDATAAGAFGTDGGGFGYTSIEFGPDGKLYVATITGVINRWDVNPDGTLDLASAETLNLGYFDDRSIIGLAFDPEDPNTIWVTDNANVPRSGKAFDTEDFSGQLTKITLGSGGAFETAVAETYITGLPRSGGDHVTNSIEFRANPDAGVDGAPEYLLYFTQGSNSAAGSPDNAWGFRPERLLSAAVLEVDHTRDTTDGPFDVQTEPYDPAVNDPTFRTTDAFNADGTFPEFYDPFADGAVLKIYGEGIRNAYDLVWHSNGNLYVPTNGTARGGNTLDDPDTDINEAITGLDKQFDYLFQVQEGGYYGHPNELLDNYVVNGGAGGDPNIYGSDNAANTSDGGNEYADGVVRDADYDIDGAYSLDFNKSPNGATEYFNDAFGENLQGAVLFAQFSQGDNVRYVLVDPVTGRITFDDVLRRPGGDEINEYIDPLDIIENPLTGQLYLMTLNRGTGGSEIILLNPAPGGVATDNTADEGNDLALVVVNTDDPANVVFEIVGLDDDIQTITVAFDGGAAQPVTPDGNNQFTASVGADSGTVSAVLTVTDDNANTASDTTTVVFDTTGDGSTTIDALSFTVLSTLTGTSATIIRDINDPSTHESGGGNDSNGDGLNDGFDGGGYLDPNGVAEDKASFTYVAAAAGVYEFSFRVAANNDRSISINTGDQAVPITVNTGSFTNWQSEVITLTLEAGVNTIVIEQTSASGPNIDSVTITPQDVEDVTADEGGDLDIVVVDLSDLSNASFSISGADNDLTTLSVAFSDGTATATATPVGNGLFTVDLSGLSGDATAILTVVDDAGNIATDAAAFSLDETIPNDGTEQVNNLTYVIYEAENATLDGPVVATEDRTQSGDFVDFDGTTDQSITWTVQVPQDGDYALDIIYALSTSKDPRPMTLSVDGTLIETLAFAPNSNDLETSWGPQTTTLTLDAGVHEITVTAPGANGPNVDYLRITQSPLTEPLDLTADVGDDLALIVIDQTDPAAVVLEISGLDDDITTAQITFGGGAPQSVAAVNGLVTLDSGITFGQVQAVLSIVDDAENTASAEVEVTIAPEGNPNADIGVQSLDAAFFSDRLHFSYLENNTAVTTARDFKDSATVRIENTGSEDLEFLGATVSGPFDLADETVFDNLVLAAGQTIDIEVLFDNTEINPKPANNQNGVQTGELTIVTNDAEDPFVTVDLAGFWQPRDEGGNEPNINEVWQLFGFGNQIDGLSLTGGGGSSTLDFFDLYLPEDETEVLSPYWQIAEGFTEARITQIAAYHGPGGASLGLHGPGDKGGSNEISFGSHEGTDNQTVLPTRSNDEQMTQTFTNATIPDGWTGDNVFGIEVAGLSTDPTLNPTGAGAPTQAQLDARFPGEGYTVVNGNVFDGDGNPISDGYTVRVFQAVDPEGTAIDNVFLVVMDYTGINYDYNDNMYVIEGVQPVFNGAQFVVSGLDDAAADDRLVFTNIENGPAGQEFRNEATFTISNPGFAAAAIEDITIGGADADAFEISGGSPAFINPGQSLDITVTYTGIDGVNDDAAVLQQAVLTIASPLGDQTISLAGLAQFQSEEGEEPTVAQIVEAFGYTTDVAQDALDNDGVVEAVGDEVLMPYLQRLDDTKPVEVINMAAFLQQGNISRLSIHDTDSDDLTELFAGDDNQGQTVLPDGLVVGTGDTGSVGRAILNRDTGFGLKVTVDGRPTFAAWTDPEINKADDALGVTDEGHYIRFFEAKDANGDVIEGTFIGIQDYPGGGNFDYNDAMFLVTNVQPYDLSAAEDANGNNINDALETDTDGDGTADFFDGVQAPDTQAPFGGTAPVLSDSLSVDADTFDTGGQGVAWNDDPGKNGGDPNRTDSDVEIIGGAIAFIESGEWVEYTVNVSEAGIFDLSTIAKAPTSAATINVSLENGPVLATITLPDSNGSGDNSFAGTDFGATDPVQIALAAGEQTLRFTFGGTVATNGYVMDFESFSLERVTPPEPTDQTPFPGPDAPGFTDGTLTVLAASYDDGGQGVAYNDAAGLQGGTNGGRTGSDVEVTALGDIGWINSGEWLEYTVDVPSAGTYDAGLLMALGGGSGRTVTIDVYRPGEISPYESSGAVANAPTGGWTTFAQRNAGELSLEAGLQVIRLTFEGGSQDIRSFSLTETEEPPVGLDAIGEAGKVTFTQTDEDAWFLVEFAQELDNPAVVMGPLTTNDASRSTVRVRNVTDEGFEFQLDEWDYLNGTHASETVSWLAIESGTHTVDGLSITAGIGSASAISSDIAFGTAFDDSPVVVAQVTSTNDPDAVVDRIQDVTTSGFSIELDNEELTTGFHPEEDLAWIAFEKGGAASDGLLAGSTGTAVTDEPFEFGFGGAFAEDEFVLIADMQTENGNDPALVRLTQSDADSATIFIEEDKSKDSERIHVAEDVGYVALLQGEIYDDIA